MIPGHKRVRCETPGRASLRFGQTTCHRTPLGDPTDITATKSRQIGPEETGDRRGEHHPRRTVEGRTELDLVQDEVEEAKRLLEEAHVEVQAAQNKVTEPAFRVGQAMEEMAQIKKLLEANSEPAGQ